jgi:hypothetical protein
VASNTVAPMIATTGPSAPTALDTVNMLSENAIAMAVRPAMRC